MTVKPTKRPWQPWRWLLLLGMLALAAWINLPLVSRIFDRSDERVAALPPMPGFTRGQHVLILSPHPDDETLCCAGLIQQARAAGAKVYLAWITAGDGFEFDEMLVGKVARPTPADMQKLGNTRAAEAWAAADVLGVPPAQRFMLGYPDGGLFHLFTTHYDQPFTAPHTRINHVYVQHALGPGHSFTGRNLEADITAVLNRVQPDLVFAPSVQDFHADHHTLSYIALRLMAQRGQENRLHFWVIHGGLEWPIPKGKHQDLPLTLPPRAAHLPWQRLALTPAQENTKWRAVQTYHTQTEALGRFMEAYVRTNELFSPVALPEPPVPAATVSGP